LPSRSMGKATQSRRLIDRWCSPRRDGPSALRFHHLPPGPEVLSRHFAHATGPPRREVTANARLLPACRQVAKRHTWGRRYVGQRVRR
jgi:hypothetical protein